MPWREDAGAAVGAICFPRLARERVYPLRYATHAERVTAVEGDGTAAPKFVVVIGGRGGLSVDAINTFIDWVELDSYETSSCAPWESWLIPPWLA